MPNHITTRLTATGPSDDIRMFREKCIIQVEEAPNKAYNGSIICKKQTDNGCVIGWYDEETNEFSYRDYDSGKIIEGIDGLPEGYMYDMIAAHERMDFDRIIPMPDDVRATLNTNLTMDDMDDTKGRNWYVWCRENWGTKWNAYEFEVQCESDSSIQMVFQSAWNCPLPVIEEMARLFPNLVFMLDTIDEGWDFWGNQTYSNGELIHDNISCHADKENPVFRTMVRELLGYDIEDDEEE